MTNQKPVIDTHTKKSKKSKCYIKVVTEAQGREKRRRKEQKKELQKQTKIPQMKTDLDAENE